MLLADRLLASAKCRELRVGDAVPRVQVRARLPRPAPVEDAVRQAADQHQQDLERLGGRAARALLGEAGARCEVRLGIGRGVGLGKSAEGGQLHEPSEVEASARGAAQKSGARAGRGVGEGPSHIGNPTEDCGASAPHRSPLLSLPLEDEPGGDATFAPAPPSWLTCGPGRWRVALVQASAFV